MSKKLIEQVEKYFDEESKKYSVQLHDNSILGFDSEKMKELLDNKVKDYYIVFQLRMIKYCYAISKKENMYLNNTDIDKMLEYYEKYYEYKKKEEDLKVSCIIFIRIEGYSPFTNGNEQTKTRTTSKKRRTKKDCSTS